VAQIQAGKGSETKNHPHEERKEPGAPQGAILSASQPGGVEFHPAGEIRKRKRIPLRSRTS